MRTSRVWHVYQTLSPRTGDVIHPVLWIQGCGFSETRGGGGGGVTNQSSSTPRFCLASIYLRHQGFRFQYCHGLLAGDYREVHCNKCGDHYFAGSYGGKCYTCVPNFKYPEFDY